MDKLRIKGGYRLQGQIRISGAKNSALPAMAASLLTPDEVILENLGATVRTEHGYIEAAAERLTGSEILFDKITVTGTENLMMAAALADGRTVLQNAACEPEVVDLAEMLTKMGAKIEGAGTSMVSIEGVKALRGTTHRIIPDRIETGTFLAAGAITQGEIELTDCNPAHLSSVIEKLRETGVNIELPAGTAGRMTVRGTGDLHAADVVTKEYPGFATDMQAQYVALMTQAAGTSVITENIFENRFMHASELMRMGANIRIDGARAIVTGKTQLSGATVIASDLRASASLVVAALVADGITVVDRVYHLDRGYEKIEEKLRPLGAQIERLK